MGDLNDLTKGHPAEGIYCVNLESLNVFEGSLKHMQGMCAIRFVLTIIDEKKMTISDDSSHKNHYTHNTTKAHYTHTCQNDVNHWNVKKDVKNTIKKTSQQSQVEANT